MTPRDRRRKLLARIHRRYQTITEDVRLGGMTLPFTRIADPNRVLDEVADAEDRRDKLEGKRRPGDDLHLPYWAELWDSSLAVCEWLTQDSGLGTGDSVMDLGCGMGLTGAIAATLGARVLFADLEPDTLLFARLNAIEYLDRIRTRQLNWRTSRLTERFDLIIGADILYERAQWTYLETFWRGHLRAGGRIILGEPGRQTGDLFVEWIAPMPWTLERLERKVPTREKAIRLFVLR
jgi:predicted nicotinamide N-methyase